MKPSHATALKAIAVWIARVLTGVLFILSGWAKTVDPRGFVYKINEYLTVWGIDDLVLPGLVMVGAIGLSIFELVIGVLLLTGCLRRSAAVLGLCVMAFMLPLTIYIYISHPVADCGCFGDLLVVSNLATMLKNVAATLLLCICLAWHKVAPPLYRPDLQWLVVVVTIFYGIAVAFVGWQLQPMIDFRPYSPGTSVIPAEEEADFESQRFIYERDGEQKEFTLNNLPDSTWTFVDRIEGDEAHQNPQHVVELFDGDDEVTYEVYEELAQGDAFLLCVAEPGLNNLTRSRLANELASFAISHDIDIIGIAALSGEALEQWKELSLPSFPVYSSSDTSIKELVRGEMGLVFLRNGVVQWKRNFLSLPPDLLERDRPLESIWHVDDGRLAVTLTATYGAAMLLLLLVSTLTTITITLHRRSVLKAARKKSDSANCPPQDDRLKK